MKHLIARHNNSFVVGLKDRAYFVFETIGNDSPAGSIIELLPSADPKGIRQSAPPPSIPVVVPESSFGPETSNPTNDTDNKKKPQKKGDKVHDRQKSADEQLNEICAVAVISDDNDKVYYCAVARGNKSLEIYALKLENLPTTTPQPASLHYRSPKRVSCFAFANINATGESKVPLLISGDVAGDSYAYNLLEKGQRLLLGHTASMLTDIAVINDGADNCHLLTSDRDEKIRISRFPETYVIEGFLLGHTAYVTGFVVVPSSSSTLAVSCGGDMTLRLWDLAAQLEISSTSTIKENDENNKLNEIPTAIAASSCGRIVAVIFDGSKRLSIYKIISTNTKGDQVDKPSLELLENVECPLQPLSIVFHEVESSIEGSNTRTELTVLMKDPDYVAVYDIAYENDDVEAIVVPRKELHVMQALRDVAAENKIAMPNTILEKDDYGNPVLRKENETRGPAAEDAPWNRVERIETAKERVRRRKKKAKISNDN